MQLEHCISNDSAELTNDNINFTGYDGSSYHASITINGVIDGSVNSNTVPTATISSGTTVNRKTSCRILLVTQMWNICNIKGRNKQCYWRASIYITV